MASLDPYFQFKSEIESTLLTLSTLSTSYLRLLRAPPSASNAEERSWSLSELKATLAALEVDIEELEESVKAVEERGVARRLGIGEEEVRERRAWLGWMQGEVMRIRKQVGLDKRAANPNSRVSDPSHHPLRSNAYDEEAALEGDPNTEFEMQQQTLLIQQQDQTLTSISGTVGLLREQAKVMGREVFEQNVMIEEIDAHVDSTSNRLAKAQRKLQGFIEQNQNSPSAWLIFILIIVLTALLIVIVFF